MAVQRSILIVEDDPAVSETLLDQVADDGEFAGTSAASVEEAEAKVFAPGAHFDAILLDIGLPDGDGCDLCMQLRNQGHRMPIIMLTGSGNDADVVRALNAGANDYVVKPVKSAVLLARLRAQIRAFEASEHAVFTIGPYTFRPAARLLVEATRNRRIHLTEKEVRILKFLYRMGSQSVPRQTMLNEVWGHNTGVTTHTLETHIYRLRQKIEPDPANARLLITKNGGYRLDLDGNATPAVDPHS